MRTEAETGWLPDLIYTGGEFRTGLAMFADATGRVTRFSSQPADLAHAQRLSGRALLPGLVNGHSHAFQRVLRGRTEHRTFEDHAQDGVRRELVPDSFGGARRTLCAPEEHAQDGVRHKLVPNPHGGARGALYAPRERDSFWTWRERMYHAANRLSPEALYHASRMAFLEMLLGGITTAGEFHYVHHDAGGAAYGDRNELALQVIRAARDTGLRIALLRTAYVRSGWNKPSEPGQARFLTPRVEDFIADTEALRAALAEHQGQAWVGVAPHSLRAVPLGYLQEVAAYARARQMPLHMHVSEQPADVEACLAEYKLRPVELLERNGLLDFRFTAVHAIHVTGEEISSLAGAGAMVCACPTTERNLGDGTVPADQLLHAGVRISLGSDSNVQIDLLEDARELEYHLRMVKLERAVLAFGEYAQSEARREPVPNPPGGGRRTLCASTRLFACATEAGAASLGASGGVLEAGRPADFFTVALDDPSLAGADAESMLDHIVFAAERSAVRDVAVGGKFVVRDGRHQMQEEIVREFTRVQRELWR